MRLFEALRRRRHYGTTGTRLFLDLRATFDQPVTGFTRRPAARPGEGIRGARSVDGRHHPARLGADAACRRSRSAPRRSSASMCCTAPRSCKRCVRSRPPISAAACACMWQGAEYRGRGRETMWQGKLTLAGNRFTRFAPVNFLNPGTQGARNRARHRAGLDFGDDRQSRGHRHLARRGAARHAHARNQRRLRRGRSRDARRRHGCHSTAAASAGGSASTVCPSTTGAGVVAVEHVVTFSGGADLPVYVRVTQSDGHQAWSSPIYLIA